MARVKVLDQAGKVVGSVEESEAGSLPQGYKAQGGGGGVNSMPTIPNPVTKPDGTKGADPFGPHHQMRAPGGQFNVPAGAPTQQAAAPEAPAREPHSGWLSALAGLSGGLGAGPRIGAMEMGKSVMTPSGMMVPMDRGEYEGNVAKAAAGRDELHEDHPGLYAGGYGVGLAQGGITQGAGSLGKAVGGRVVQGAEQAAGRKLLPQLLAGLGRDSASPAVGETVAQTLPGMVQNATSVGQATKDVAPLAGLAAANAVAKGIGVPIPWWLQIGPAHQFTKAAIKSPAVQATAGKALPGLFKIPGAAGQAVTDNIFDQEQ